MTQEFKQYLKKRYDVIEECNFATNEKLTKDNNRNYYCLELYGYQSKLSDIFDNNMDKSILERMPSVLIENRTGRKLGKYINTELILNMIIDELDSDDPNIDELHLIRTKILKIVSIIKKTMEQTKSYDGDYCGRCYCKYRPYQCQYPDDDPCCNDCMDYLIPFIESYQCHIDDIGRILGDKCPFWTRKPLNIKNIIQFQTSNGTIFNNIEQAEKYELCCIIKQDILVFMDKYKYHPHLLSDIKILTEKFLSQIEQHKSELL